MTICDFEQPECASCGATMALADNCEWDDDPEKNICHECAMKRLEKIREALVAYMSASEYCPNTSEETITKVEQLLGAVLGGGE